MHFAFVLDRSGRFQQDLRSACRSLWSDVVEKSSGDCLLLMQTRTSRGSAHADDAMIGAASGWIRHDDLPAVTADPATERAHVSALLRALRSEPWPLNDVWTGQFAAVVFDCERGRLILCNDALGYVPLYFAERNGAVIGGTSLIAMGRAGFTEPDPLGVAQRISRAVSNFGGRTVLRDVRRLLPGERRTYRSGTASPEQAFDDSFCATLTDGPIESVAEEAWGRYKKETAAAVGATRETVLALSGGWDSRLALAAAVQTGTKIKCVTYGAEDLYETRIALRVADVAGCECTAFPLAERYFPPVESYRQLVAQVENANLLQWWPILSQTRRSPDPSWPDLMLLGDYWDVLDARRLYGLSKRGDRARMTLGAVVGRRPRMAPSTPANFEEWKRARTEEVFGLVRTAAADLSDPLRSNLTDAALDEGLREDLREDYARVKANWPPFAPQFEHLFWWFHRSRYYIGGQGLTLSGAYRTAVPGASFRFTRFASTIHPALLVRRRLLDAIGRLPELDRFARIPSATIPWVSLRAPSIVREGVWGARWAIDTMLTRRMLRRKDPNARQWAIPTENYLREYRRPESLDRVRSWFSGRWIDPDRFVGIARARASMESVPLITADITVPANVSLLLDLCNEH